MRLLNAETYELKDIRQNVAYAILSHRWYEEEITFDSLNAAQLQNHQEQSPQLDKIRGTCAQAVADGLKWVWIDSCCINKESSQELTRSINSMFQWYQKAEVCYTYLTDVASSTLGGDVFARQEAKAQSKGKHSEWFERGWTLQELLAPHKMVFFDRDWQPIGTRAELANSISRITGIEAAYLTGADDFRNASVATRLSWQAGRRTTEIEDIAYSLIGVLGVQLVPTYGEGRQAFQRLQEEILRTQPDESIFAWTASPGTLPTHSRHWAADQWGLLAPSPDCFINSRNITINGPSKKRPPSGIATTAEGVRFPMPRKDLQTVNPNWGYVFVFVPPFLGPLLYWAYSKYRHSSRQYFFLTLNCWHKDKYGKLNAIRVYLSRDAKGDMLWRRSRCDELGFADKVPSSSVRNGMPGWTEVTILQPTGVRWPIES